MVAHDEQFSGHVPVLYAEVLQHLQPVPGGQYVDGTVGAGGHARGILLASQPNGRLLGLDRDPDAVAFASEQLREFADRTVLVASSYTEMETVAAEHGFDPIHGVLLDLGLSSRQLDSAERGFSFIREGPLDMRFDRRAGASAADLINNLDEEALADIFWRYGEERRSRQLARLIVDHRPLTTTEELATLIEAHSGRRGARHPATQLFQALRIAVNDELAAVEAGLEAAVRVLQPGGRLAVISFHSLEDRLVKQFFRQKSQTCICPPEQLICDCEVVPELELIVRKAIKASEHEVRANPRSRSARLRVARKTRQEAV